MAPPKEQPAAAAKPVQTVTAGVLARARKAGSGFGKVGSTLAIIVEILIIIACLGRAGHLIALQARSDSLARAQKQSDEIRKAWAELADQGAMLQIRIEKSAGGIDEFMDYVDKAASKAGITPEKTGPVVIRNTSRVRTSRIILRTTAPEKRILNFLLIMDNSPTVTEVEMLDLTGAPKGEVAMKLHILHHAFTSGTLKELKEFVGKLPAVTGRYEHRSIRRGGIFLPAIVVDSEAMRGWPRVMLSGFSEDKALMVIKGEARTLAVGDTVTQGIIYADKISVNQAVLRRTKDNSEIILTVGTSNYALRASEVRGMSEIVLTFQKRASYLTEDFSKKP